MTHSAASSSARSASIAKALLGDRHFLLAAGILAVTAAGWGAATQWLNLTTFKERCAWPLGPPPVRVGEDFHLITFAERFGPYRKGEANDEVMKASLPEALRVGEVLFDKKLLEPLGIGTVVDRDHLADRKSNWYMVRRYVDPRPGAKVRVWQLEVYYYTGGADTVPHIPDICMEAGGATVLSSDSVRFSVPTAPDPWSKTVSFHCTRHTRGGQTSATYYVFSMNGVFGESRLWVRWELLYPFVRHAYFAKIQFSPLVGTADSKEMDRLAEEFMQHALPEVLKALPSSRDVKALEQARR